MGEVSQVLTWATLLARWTEFARGAVALPLDGESGRIRQAVPFLIGLQALTNALAELERLPYDERAVGLDRAELLIGRYGADIASIWTGRVPESVKEFVGDAQLALSAAAARHRPQSA
jgi:hypothetical protein